MMGLLSHCVYALSNRASFTWGPSGIKIDNDEPLLAGGGWDVGASTGNVGNPTICGLSHTQIPAVLVDH